MNDSRQHPKADDWRRRGQESYLAGRILIEQRYQPYREGWDHDHCEFCWGKFSLSPGDLHAGYSTEDSYHWVCPDCYEDFKDEFNWISNESSA